MSSTDSLTRLVSNGRTELREGYAEVGDVRLHYVEGGDGPLIVLLHGFPEFWYGWRRQITPLAASGLRVVAPDQRGYNLSDKPAGIAAYHLDTLADDVLGLAEAPRSVEPNRRRRPPRRPGGWFRARIARPGDRRRRRVEC